MTHIKTYELYIHLPTITSNSWVRGIWIFHPHTVCLGEKSKWPPSSLPSPGGNSGDFSSIFLVFGIGFVGVIRVIFAFHVFFLCFCLSVWNGFLIPRSGDLAQCYGGTIWTEYHAMYIYIYVYGTCSNFFWFQTTRKETPGFCWRVTASVDGESIC